ncbi:prepilin peptidase [Paenibacillus sp. FJAT-26967]|uniref:A24 family peptidase n=1 Tax=Paenibacillus sp. FJAT-26967 TaxID=1729690 RepID=UPI0008380A40|nr:prepilin peptidase [Paenibacillus sp. FJAT-26967]
MEQILLSLLILGAFVTDVHRSVIPNVLTCGGIAAGVLYHAISGGWQGFVYSISGLAAGFLLFLVLYLIGALGAGDVKLFAAIGALTGTVFVLECTVYSLLFAGGIGLVIMLVKKDAKARIFGLFGYLGAFVFMKDLTVWKNIRTADQLRFPFMYAVLPGVLTAYLYGEAII